MALLLVLLVLFCVPACNTVEGFGQDLKQVGKNIEDEAKEEQKD